jgi:spore germination protein KC
MCKKMRKFLLLLLLFTLILTSVTGCYDSREATEVAYVYSIGLDKGVTDKLRMTIQIPKAPSSSGEGQGAQGQVAIENITIDCPSFYAGVNMINTFVDKDINYTHTQFLVFSEELAREGIDTYLTAFIRGRQIRRNINVIVSKGPVSEFLKENKATISASLSRREQLIMNQSQRTGLFEDITYGEMLNELKTPYGQPIAVLAAINYGNNLKDSDGASELPFKTSGDYYAGELARTGGSKVEFLGTAVFDGGKMVGQLNGDETRAMMMIRDDFKRGFFAIKDPKSPDKVISLDVRRQKKPNIKVKLDEDKATISIKIFLEADILAIQSTIDYESKELLPLIEKGFKEQVQKELDKTIKKCQSLNSDVFRIGTIVAMKFNTIEEFEEFNWLRNFKDAQITTQVEFKVKRTGTLLKSSEMFSSEGKKGE